MSPGDTSGAAGRSSASVAWVMPATTGPGVRLSYSHRLGVAGAACRSTGAVEDAGATTLPVGVNSTMTYTDAG